MGRGGGLEKNSQWLTLVPILCEYPVFATNRLVRMNMQLGVIGAGQVSELAHKKIQIVLTAAPGNAAFTVG